MCVKNIESNQQSFEEIKKMSWRILASLSQRYKISHGQKLISSISVVTYIDQMRELDLPHFVRDGFFDNLSQNPHILKIILILLFNYLGVFGLKPEEWVQEKYEFFINFFILFEQIYFRSIIIGG
jgi:hypothetical protein